MHTSVLWLHPYSAASCADLSPPCMQAGLIQVTPAGGSPAPDQCVAAAPWRSHSARLSPCRLCSGGLIQEGLSCMGLLRGGAQAVADPAYMLAACRRCSGGPS